MTIPDELTITIKRAWVPALNDCLCAGLNEAADDDDHAAIVTLRDAIQAQFRIQAQEPAAPDRAGPAEQTATSPDAIVFGTDERRAIRAAAAYLAMARTLDDTLDDETDAASRAFAETLQAFYAARDAVGPADVAAIQRLADRIATTGGEGDKA